jgi:ABC-2 type transport system permease protein
MRFEKSWIIVRKEFSEFRKNKYILYSLFLMPILMAVVLPTVYLVPISTFATPPANHPLDLGISIVQELQGSNLSNGTAENIRFFNTNLDNMIVYKCEFFNCSIVNSVVRDSNLTSSTITNSVVEHSNLRFSATTDSSTPGSLFLGSQSESEKYLVLIIDSLLMFFVLIPAIIPTVIASYSFVGEKLNKSLEPLLATPTSDTELLMGKTLAIFIPSVLVTWISLLPAVIIVDLVTYPILGYYILPNMIWIIGVFFVAPLFCILSVLVNVIISARVSDVRTSQQIGSIVVLPAIAFFIVALAGIVVLNEVYMLLFGTAILAIDLVVFYVALRVFQREEILVKWK